MFHWEASEREGGFDALNDVRCFWFVISWHTCQSDVNCALVWVWRGARVSTAWWLRCKEEHEGHAMMKWNVRHCALTAQTANLGGKHAWYHLSSHKEGFLWAHIYSAEVAQRCWNPKVQKKKKPLVPLCWISPKMAAASGIPFCTMRELGSVRNNLLG